MSDLKELTATVEELRSRRYAELPSELVRQILVIESETLESAKAAKLIERVVDEWLSTKEAK